jgi:FixJ family two-component response regulator
LPNSPVISIIDDDASVRKALTSFVRSLGLRACAFASAQEFLTSPRIGDTSCLISDVQLPGMRGLELQGVLRAQSRHVPIIFITAFPNENVRSRAIKAGAVGFLHKPFSDQDLVACLETALKRRDAGTGPP